MHIKIFDHNIHYKIINKHFLPESDNVFIFLHEGLGSVAQWKSFPNELSDTLSIPALIYDRFGHGLSSQRTVSGNLEFFEEEAFEYLPELVEKLNLNDKQLILIGHSDGATIALLYASKSQNNIKAVVSIAAHVFMEKITETGVEKLLQSYKNGNFREKLYKYHKENTDNMFYNWAESWLNPDNENWNIFSFLEKINQPVLAMQGKNDQYGSEEQLNRIKVYIPAKVNVIGIDSCGHSPHIEKPEDLIKSINSFLVSLL